MSRLPATVTDTQMRTIFREYGPVDKMSIHVAKGEAKVVYRYHESVLLATKEVDGMVYPGSDRPIEVRQVADRKLSTHVRSEKKVIRFFWEISINSGLIKYYYDFQTGKTTYDRPPADSVVLTDEKYYVESESRPGIEQEQ